MKFTALTFGLLMASSAFGYKYVGPGVNGGHEGESQQNLQADNSRAAACSPASGTRDLQWNNVKALIETGGSMWQDRSNSNSAYVVPKDGDVSVLYAGALWMGGLSPDQQLKLAAVRFRTDGNDYWPGPLTNDGSAEVDEATCAQYDDFFVSWRTDAQLHRQYWDCVNDPECDLAEQELTDYIMPSYFNDYPAQGNTALNQDFYLAPFKDYDGDGFYNPSNGDYPWYDFLQEIDCTNRQREDLIPLFGDQTYYWIFNDKGNVHSESQGEPIGMEIRAQAFAFATNDEINNMTFYNYVLLNQGTQTLTNTYFGQWVDADVGTATDDYVGCDVQRGLGYAYNGDAFDESSNSSNGYGEYPPAVGVDFFEGPYQDADGIDNPLTTNFSNAIDSLGIPYKGIGIGYGDGFADNERFGMRKFLYYNNSLGINGEPGTALDYYNYMQGYWKNGQRMGYYGDGLNPLQGTDLSIATDYMFPGDTDPNNWGTQGVPVDEWTELTSGNAPNDRRFIQSAGPFTLQPGDYNNITVGVVYARATAGDPFEAVELVRVADDKAQALFDNCFEIVSGPDAPDITIQEVENELILYLTNENPVSNNHRETAYDENLAGFDPIIPEFHPITDAPLSEVERSYLFQGYQVYQVADATVSVTELDNPDKARLIFQSDIRDGITQAINYTTDPDFEEVIPIPELMVDGADEGILHSYHVVNDAFATGDSKLVNHKTYYFMALAYATNNYMPYSPALLQGQDVQYLASRKSATGEIRTYAGIPHTVAPENGGTEIYTSYGDGVEITKLEGRGCGLADLEITEETRQEILTNGFAEEVTFVAGNGPVNVKVIDPTRLPEADFELRLAPDNTELDQDSVYWELTNLTSGEVYTSARSFHTQNEDLLLDVGLSVSWNQHVEIDEDGNELDHFSTIVRAEKTYADPTMPWLEGIPDSEGFTELNWIRAGTSASEDLAEEIIFDDSEAGSFWDPEEDFEGILGGTWSPYCLVSYTDDVTLADGSNITMVGVAPTSGAVNGDLSAPPNEYRSNIQGLNNADIVFTADKSLWTRCAVIEMQGIPDLTDTGTGEKMKLRDQKSVDKNGRNEDHPNCNVSEATAGGSQDRGMGWFPGYAIDVETGERLNMAFGEDSFLSADNGNDMIWNPSDRTSSFIGQQTYAGGQHWIYVFKNMKHEAGSSNRMPAYDNGDYLFNNLYDDFTSSNRLRVFRACTWVGSALSNPAYPMLSVEDGLIPTTCTIKLRVAKPYDKHSVTQFDTDDITDAQNYWNPFYTFSTRNIAAQDGQTTVLSSVLDDINIVPNPYYAFSQYETTKLDNRVKITNLPRECTVTIYNVTGTLVRQYQKADPLTSLDWDLKNHRNVPIASGVYIIHIDVPGVGQKVLKWFGVMRPTDLDNF